MTPAQKPVPRCGDSPQAGCTLCEAVITCLRDAGADTNNGVHLENNKSSGLPAGLIEACAMQELRVATEWRRWEQADKWHWDPHKRQQWAQGLWRAQHVRSLRSRLWI